MREDMLEFTQDENDHITWLYSSTFPHVMRAVWKVDDWTWIQVTEYTTLHPFLLSHNMENMNMQNTQQPPSSLGGGGSGGGGGGGQQMPPPVPQLPPQMFTTAAQLLDLTDSEHFATIWISVSWVNQRLTGARLSLRIEKLMVSLRDGRKLIGVLRSWDQFGMRRRMRRTIVLQSQFPANRRHMQEISYFKIRWSVCLRKTCMLMLIAVSFLLEERMFFFLVKLYESCHWTFRLFYPADTCTHQQDLDRDDHVPAPFQQAPLDQVFELHKQEQAQKKKQEKMRHKKLAAYGFEGEHSGEAILWKREGFEKI
jgi:U6 snRNA-associated Sm-like protein LSm1